MYILRLIKYKGCDRILTDKQTSELKKSLLEQKEQLDKLAESFSLEHGSIRDMTSELSTLDNHPADLGTELYDREKDMALQVHEVAELKKVTEALEAMDNGSYGVCDECGDSIPFERLEAVPYTTRCIEHADKDIPQTRPIEEQVLHPAVDNSFAGRREGEDVRNYEDSFQVVAQYGTSETAADFTGDFDDINDLYDDEDEVGMDEDIDQLHVTNIGGVNREVTLGESIEAVRNDYVE